MKKYKIKFGFIVSIIIIINLICIAGLYLLDKNARIPLKYEKTLASIVVNITIFTMIILLVYISIKLSNKISSIMKRIEEYKQTKPHLWLNSSKFGSVYEFQEKIGIWGLEFNGSVKMTPQKIAFLKKHIKDKISDDEMNEWLTYFKAGNTNDRLFWKLILPVVISFSGFEYIAKTLPKVHNVLLQWMINDPTDSSELKLISFLVLLLIISILFSSIAFLYDAVRTTRLRGMYKELLESIIRDDIRDNQNLKKRNRFKKMRRFRHLY